MYLSMFTPLYESFMTFFFYDVISTTLKQCLRVLPVLLILALRELSQKSCTTFAGVLPQQWYSVSGSTPDYVIKGTKVQILPLTKNKPIGLGVLPETKNKSAERRGIPVRT